MKFEFNHKKAVLWIKNFEMNTHNYLLKYTQLMKNITHNCIFLFADF